MNSDVILILEDNEERIAAFTAVAKEIAPDCRPVIWREAWSMINEAEPLLSQALLISLDHDLNPQPGSTRDPGTGLDVAIWLAQQTPACPVIVHSTNHERVESMINELRFGRWSWDRVGPFGNAWIETAWRRKATALIEGFRATRASASPRNKPRDHAERMKRASVSFTGLSVGDAFGERFFGPHLVFEERVIGRHEPPPPWIVTDDTIMATSVVEVLNQYGHIERLALAKAFANRYALDPARGYGGTAHDILRELQQGVSWMDAAGRVFNGTGSLGNGAAMRVAPLGAYFGEDYARVASEAVASAEVTHAHPEGKAGAIAVAVAAAWVASETNARGNPAGLLEAAYSATPDGETRRGIASALRIPFGNSPTSAAQILGNGSRICAPDTVPVCLWLAARHLNDYREALWSTVSIAGDIDTNCAIVGGIVVLATGVEGVPTEWLQAREQIPFQNFIP